MPIGAKRNWLCGQARGTIIAHFDDDDYNSPARLMDQVTRLLESGAQVTGYHSMRFTDGTRWWKYTGAPDYGLGTSLVYRKDFWVDNPFPELQVGEDNYMVGQARRVNGIVSVDAGTMQIATVHPGNTSPRNLATGSFTELS